MKLNAKTAAGLVGGKITGNPEAEIKGVSKIEEAVEGDLTFLYLASYEKYLETTGASVVLIGPSIKKGNKNITYIDVENPNLAFQKILTEYFNNPPSLSGTDSSAFIDPAAKTGENIAIGRNVVISAGCEIGNNVKIMHNVVLLENCSVGDNTIIYPNVTLREETKIGKNVIIHAGVVLGGDGFGFTPDSDGVYRKIPQIGNVVIKDNVEIGANTTIDRAAMGSTVIGNGVKIDNLVQIAHNVVIGNNTVLSSQTGVSGSTKIGNNCILAGQVGIVGHIELADGVIIAAQSGVSKSLKKPGKYFGYPAKEMITTLKLEAHIRNLPVYSQKLKDLEKKIKELSEKLNN